VHAIDDPKLAGRHGRSGPGDTALVPVGQSSTAKFWDAAAETYARSPIADEASYRTKLSVTQQHLRPDMDVLELGCGTGSTALIHAAFVRHIHAIDISEKMLAIARRKAAAAAVTNIRFEQAAIDAFDGGEARYDAVLALSVLHLLADKEAVIGKARRWLRPGGLFVSSTPCLGDGMWYLKPVLPVMRLIGRAPEVVTFFTARELERSFTEAGFVIEHTWQPGRNKAVFMIARKPDGVG
jgi:2-polyprenyl-3-methyl-5-hydroxy-6-metoxy-1,4-benzoquinol methylase